MKSNHIYPNYNPQPVHFVKGEKEYLYDNDGKRYIDMIGGIAVNCLGHAHPNIIEAISDQAAKLMHISNLYPIEWQSKLADYLIELSHREDSKLNRVLFQSSGTEANEAAFKMARFYGQGIDKKKFKIISLKGSFHGRTFASNLLTGQDKGKNLFGPLPEGFIHIEPDNIQELEAHFSDEIAAFFLEVVQGEGGVRPLSEQYLHKVQELCEKHKALLVCDEIQAGIFRMEKFWGHQVYKLKPDVVTAAKGMGGGIPIGALLCSEALAQVLVPGTHGTTYGGNPLACRVSYTVLKTLDEMKIWEHVQVLSGFLDDRLESLKKDLPEKVLAHRGAGLWRGIKLADKINTREVMLECLRRGIAWGTAGDNCMRLAPALIISQESLVHGIDILKQVLEERS